MATTTQPKRVAVVIRSNTMSDVDGIHVTEGLKRVLFQAGVQLDLIIIKNNKGWPCQVKHGQAMDHLTEPEVQAIASMYDDQGPATKQDTDVWFDGLDRVPQAVSAQPKGEITTTTSSKTTTTTAKGIAVR